jgi:DNA-binding NarL/FixJ family response regulator
VRITIAIADDSNLIRSAIAALLRGQSDFQVIGECSNGREMLELIERSQPNVALVDMAMPELNGVETAQRIKKLSPKTRVIVLSNYTDEAYVQGAIEAGAVGYIVKDGWARDLVLAIRDGSRGKLYFSAEVEAVAQNLNRSGRMNLTNRKPLSPREREVLQLIAEGYSSSEIAARLGIAETTIKTHRNHIMEKLEIHDTAGLTRHAIRIGLIRAS